MSVDDYVLPRDHQVGLTSQLLFVCSVLSDCHLVVNVDSIEDVSKVGKHHGFSSLPPMNCNYNFCTKYFQNIPSNLKCNNKLL